MKVLVTGGTGFIGRALVGALLAGGFQVRVAGRGQASLTGVDWHPLGDLSGTVDWARALEGMEAVVHLAGLAHRFPKDPDYDAALYDRINHRATRDLVQAVARQPSITRFLFASSLGVHGGSPPLPMTSLTPFSPATPYDHSKVEAERAIREVLAAGKVHWAILRPALVYGPGHPGNMAKLEGLILKGRPIPLGGPNLRSFIFVDNLADVFVTYLAAPFPPSGRAWPVADGYPISTEALVAGMAAGMGRKARLVRLPSPVLGALTALGDGLGRLGLPSPWNSEVRNKLLGDFHVDLTDLRRELGWTPPFTPEEGLRLTYAGQTPRPRRMQP